MLSATNRQNKSVQSDKGEFLLPDPCHQLAFYIVGPIIKGKGV